MILVIFGDKLARRRKYRVRYVPKAKRYSRRSKGFGGINLKTVVLGGALLTAVKWLQRSFLPIGKYGDPVSLVGAGAIGSMVGVDGKYLINAGLMDGVSELALGFLGSTPVMGVSTSGGGWDA